MIGVDENEKQARRGFGGLLERTVMTWGTAPRTWLLLALIFYLPFELYTWLSRFLSLHATVELVGQTFLGTGASIFMTASAWVGLRGLESREGTCFGRIKDEIRENMGDLVKMSAFASIAVGLGTLACYVPGLVMAIFLLFSGPIVMQQGLTGMDALRRGREVVGEGRWIGVVTFVAALGVAYFLLVLVPGFFVGFSQMAGHSNDLDPARMGASRLGYRGSITNIIIFESWRTLFQLFLASFSSIWLAHAWNDFVSGQEEAKSSPPASAADDGEPAAGGRGPGGPLGDREPRDPRASGGPRDPRASGGPRDPRASGGPRDPRPPDGPSSPGGSKPPFRR